MKAFPSTGSAHPHLVAIPDARAEGVRAYREPDEPRPLQRTFLEEAGERAWVEEMRDLLSRGRADAAWERLSGELSGFDGALARLCRETANEAVVIEGWEDLGAILSEWEGPPVTAITLGLTNPPDLVFDSGRTHEPELLLGLYSDEAYPFSTAPADELLAECGRDLPAWVGHEEDVEFYCRAEGLGALNTALIGHKHRYFLRDGRDGVQGRAPGGYVEYVLATWLRSTRFLQAVQRLVAAGGQPSGCRLIVGAVGMHADFLHLIEPTRARPAVTAGRARPEPAFATLTMKPWTPKDDPLAAPASGASLRQRIAEPPAPSPADPAEAPVRRSWLARLFGRSRRS